jgi:DHA2 family multidrug resistance protein
MLVWLVAIATVFIQPRIVMACGFAIIGTTCWMAAHLDASWAGNSFRHTELLVALGIGVAFVGLIVSLVTLALEIGAAKSLINAATYSGCMHTMRLMGGQVGAVLLARFVTVREHFHSNILGLNVDTGSWLAGERLGNLGAFLGPSSAGAVEAQARSVVLLGSQVRAQAFTLAYSDGFLLIAGTISAYLILLAFLRPSTIDLRRMGKAQ